MAERKPFNFSRVLYASMMFDINTDQASKPPKLKGRTMRP